MARYSSGKSSKDLETGKRVAAPSDHYPLLSSGDINLYSLFVERAHALVKAADSDPRRPFAETLIAALRGTKLPIIVYSSYERVRLTELAKHYPDLAKPLHSIVRRLADLLPVVRSGIYHPDFDFSASIKTAAPALCPDVTYDGLQEIADGGAASTAFWSMASGRTDAETSERLRRSLREYCHRDTWAMVRLHQALDALS